MLVYLGFLGDDGIAVAGAPFTNQMHWESVFGNYAYTVVPKQLFEKRIAVGPAGSRSGSA